MNTNEELNALNVEPENKREWRKLSDAELKYVSGGDPTSAAETEMHCTNCKKVVYWKGNFMSGRYDCSGCGGIQSVYGYMYYPSGR